MMSTYYRELKNPITSIRADDKGSHIHISIWSRHGLVGTLIVDEKNRLDFIRMFCGEEILQHVNGEIIRLVKRVITDSEYIVSEYGAIGTVEELYRLYSQTT